MKTIGTSFYFTFISRSTEVKVPVARIPGDGCRCAELLRSDTECIQARLRPHLVETGRTGERCSPGECTPWPGRRLALMAERWTTEKKKILSEYFSNLGSQGWEPLRKSRQYSMLYGFYIPLVYKNQRTLRCLWALSLPERPSGRSAAFQDSPRPERQTKTSELKVHMG